MKRERPYFKQRDNQSAVSANGSLALGHDPSHSSLGALSTSVLVNKHVSQVAPSRTFQEPET